jgi:hypothetical protein
VLQVLDGFLQYRDVVIEVTEPGITGEAEHPTDQAGLVIVIDMVW